MATILPAFAATLKMTSPAGYHALDQTRIQGPQSRHMQFGAGLGKCPVGDMAQQASTDTFATLVGKEAVKLVLHAATAKATQGSHQRGQGQFARAGESRGEIRVPGLNRKGRALDVFGQLGQNRLYRITVLRQKSCQPHENNQLNQHFIYYSGLSSVDCGATPLKPPSPTPGARRCRGGAGC